MSGQRMIIKRIQGRQVLDARGRPTVEAEVETAGGVIGRAIVPSGASTGSAEALELRDGDHARGRFQGWGVLRAVGHVNHSLAEAVQGMDVRSQRKIDERMILLDGTVDRSRLGANAILAVSMAVAKTAAKAQGTALYTYFHNLGHRAGPGTLLPLPMINVLSGGLHARGGVDFQDYMAIPVGASRYAEALAMVSDVMHAVRTLLVERHEPCLGLADEGGYAARLDSNQAGCELLVAAIERAGYRLGVDCAIGLDVAATHFYHEGGYHLVAEGRVLDRDGMITYLEHLADRYPIVSLEDGLAEDDWEGWAVLTARLGNRLQIVGDDVFATHLDRIAEGIGLGVANAVLIKMNQVGTVTETIDAMARVQKAGYAAVVSARSGETEDTTIADLAVGTDAGQIKVGSLRGADRTAKWNQLLRIEEELEQNASWLGVRSLKRSSTPPP